MPGSVANAVVPTVSGNPLVFPRVTWRSLVELRAVPVRGNEYHDGDSSQRMNLANTARRSWKGVVRLAPTPMQAMIAFLKAHGTDPFYFYNPREPASGQLDGSNYDATGASLTGRYTVRYVGDIQETIYMPRAEVPIELLEIA